MTAPYQFVWVVIFFGVMSNAAWRAAERIRKADERKLADEVRYARLLALLLIGFWVIAIIELTAWLMTDRDVGHLFFWFCTAGLPGIFIAQSVWGVHQIVRKRMTELGMPQPADEPTRQP